MKWWIPKTNLDKVELNLGPKVLFKKKKKIEKAL